MYDYRGPDCLQDFNIVCTLAAVCLFYMICLWQAKEVINFQREEVVNIFPLLIYALCLSVSYLSQTIIMSFL